MMASPANMNDMDLFLLSVPLIFFLIVGYFRLDGLLASRAERSSQANSRSASQSFAERSTESMFTDPDGQPWD